MSIWRAMARVNSTVKPVGRPRSARRVFEDYVAALPADQLLPAANGLAVCMQASDPRLAARTRDWPDGTHPLDLLAERWFAVSFGEDAPTDERVKELVGMVRDGGSAVTPYARKRALGELARCAPQRLTAPLLLWAGSQFKSEGDHVAAVEELQQVLAMHPDPAPN